MAKRTGEYVPDEETLKRLMLHLNGNGSAEDEAYLRELYQRDPNFAYYYKRARAAMGGAARGRCGFGNGAIANSARPGLNSRLQQRNYGGQASGRTISPGGFKKSGLDIDAERIRSGESTVPAAFQDFSFDRNSNIIFNGRKYSPRQVEWIKSRARSGATLSADQQAIYDATVQARNINAQRRAAALAKRQSDIDKAKAKQEADEADITKRLRDRADWKFKLDAKNAAARADYEAKKRFDAEQKKAAKDTKKAAEDARFEALNEKHGLAAGTRLSQKDYDDLEAGRKKYGYSRRDQEAVDKIRSDLDDARRSLIFNSNEWNRVTKEADDKIAGFDKRIIDNDNPLTAEQIYNGAFKGPDGTLYVTDGKGGLSPIKGTEPQKEVETPSQKRAIELENARRTYILKSIDDARKNWNSTSEEIENPNNSYEIIKNPNYGKPFDPTAAITAANENWNAVTGGQVKTYTCPLCQSQMPSPDGPCPVCGWPNQNVEFDNPEAPAAPADNGGDWTSGFGGVDPRATYEEE